MPWDLFSCTCTLTHHCQCTRPGKQSVSKIWAKQKSGWGGKSLKGKMCGRNKLIMGQENGAVSGLSAPGDNLEPPRPESLFALPLAPYLEKRRIQPDTDLTTFTKIHFKILSLGETKNIFTPRSSHCCRSQNGSLDHSFFLQSAETCEGFLLTPSLAPFPLFSTMYPFVLLAFSLLF